MISDYILLDIPSLTEDGIQMKNSFLFVERLSCFSTTLYQIMIEMLILFIDLSDRGVTILEHFDKTMMFVSKVSC